MNNDINAYNKAQQSDYNEVCLLLAKEIQRALPMAESKVRHAHPVWFIGGNPIVGYDALKDSIRPLFWSGQSFDELGLRPSGSFKAAEARYTNIEQICTADLHRWLEKSKTIQWDYKNIVKRRGVLKMLK